MYSAACCNAVTQLYPTVLRKRSRRGKSCARPGRSSGMRNHTYETHSTPLNVMASAVASAAPSTPMPKTATNT